MSAFFMKILVITIAVFVGFLLPVLGQGSSRTIPAPAEERFVEVTDFLIPWLNSRCPMQNGVDAPVPNCVPHIGLEGWSYHRLALYNSDGSPWYAFSIVPHENDAFIARGSS